MDRRCGEPIAADEVQHSGVKTAVPLEAVVDRLAEAVVPSEFVEQFEDDARAEPVHGFDEPPALKTADGLLLQKEGWGISGLGFRRPAKTKGRPARPTACRAR